MKTITLFTLASLSGLFFMPASYGQQKATETTSTASGKDNAGVETVFFQDVRDYANLPIVAQEPFVDETARPKTPDPADLNLSQHALKSNQTASFNAGSFPDGYTSSWTSGNQTVGFSPAVYDAGGYIYQWQPATFTLSQPAVSVTASVYDYYDYYNYWYYYYYGARFYYYNENGQYIGTAVSNHNYGWGEVTFQAPVGNKIKYIVVQNKHYSNYSWYLWYMTITYESNNPPVALAQNITVSANQNCQATINASQIDNGSYDPDGDLLNISLSSTGPFPVGTTQVTLNVSDGTTSASAYANVTVVDNAAPLLTQPAPLSFSNDSGVCGAAVQLNPPLATDNCGVASVTSDAPAFFTTGETVVTWTALDVNGNTSQTTQTVTVVDAEAPVLLATTHVKSLWPANHNYQTISLSELLVSASDNCGISSQGVYIKSVSSDEPEDANGGGDGNTKEDMVIGNDCSSLFLRAEREGNGNGRVYTITLAVSDEAGNESTATCYVQVPHNKKDLAVNDGADSGYTIFGNCGGKSGMIINTDFIMNATASSLEVYPNPFTHSTVVKFELSDDSYVNLSIYDITGHQVINLLDNEVSSGQHQINWSGVNTSGTSLAGGMYFIILKTDHEIVRSTIIKGN